LYQGKGHKTFGAIVMAGISDRTSADLDVLENVGDNTIQSSTETCLDAKEKAQVLGSPQAAEMQLLGTDTAKR
jgi:hypothetical protein